MRRSCPTLLPAFIVLGFLSFLLQDDQPGLQVEVASDTVGGLVRRIGDGQPFDVVFASQDGLKRLAAAGRVVAPGAPAPPPREDWGMLGAIVETDQGPWFFKMTGPAATVSASRIDVFPLPFSPTRRLNSGWRVSSNASKPRKSLRRSVSMRIGAHVGTKTAPGGTRCRRPPLRCCTFRVWAI